jgi:hypothetical protein
LARDAEISKPVSISNHPLIQRAQRCEAMWA